MTKYRIDENKIVKVDETKFNINALVFVDMGEDDDIIGFVQKITKDEIVIRKYGRKEEITLDLKRVDVIPVDELPFKEKMKINKMVYGH